MTLAKTWKSSTCAPCRRVRFAGRHIDISKLRCCSRTSRKAATGCTSILPIKARTSGCSATELRQGSRDRRWLGTREFRIALSHGIDRRQINETFVLGLGQTGSAAPGERTLYFPGPEYKALHTAYDVKRANEMLDKLGLTRKDSDGYRLRTDGGGRLRLS